MGGEAQAHAFGAVEPRAGQREELREAAAQARQIAAAADVGKDADRRLRHGEERSLGRNPVAAGQGDSDAAAHRNPVHESDAGLGVGIFEVIEAIFVEEEGARRSFVALDVLADADDVAAGAEATALGMVDEDDADVGIVAPLDQRMAMSRTIWRLRLCSALGRLRRRRPARPSFLVRYVLAGHRHVHHGIMT